MNINQRTSRMERAGRDVRDHADKLAQVVADTWYGRHGSGDLEVPLSTVAALALLTPPDTERDGVALDWLNCTLDQFADWIRGLWAWFIVTRPDLFNRAWPLIEVWHGAQPIEDDTLRAAKAVADAVLRADVLGLTGTYRREEVDLLGVVLTVLRPPPALRARGQFYTPAGVAELMAQMVGIPAEGTVIGDPAAGTGGMLRAAAAAMRESGRDPESAVWVASDVDAMAIACLAINVVLWRLGSAVLLGVGNALLHDFWENAIQEREGPIRLVRDLRRERAMRDLLTAPIDELLSRAS